tara:strand:- start:4 stop:450 length:447 start_codon:yes stop_codon:yes gene_type:complete
MIQIATTKDIPELCILLNYLFEKEVEFKPNYKTQSRGLKMILNNNNIGNIFVAKKDEDIIGMVLLLYTVSTALGERVAILEDMIVSPDYRDSGVGSKLLDYAIEYGTKKGCKRITLLTDKTNVQAQTFYKRHNFNPSTMIPFRKMIKD